MGQRSRYVRLLDAAGLLGEAARIVDQAPKDPVNWGVALSRARGLSQAAYNELDDIAKECSLARGMYTSNAAARKAIVAGGEAIRIHLPQLQKHIEDTIALGPDNVLDRQAVAQGLTILAAQLSAISFTPVRKTDVQSSMDDTLGRE